MFKKISVKFAFCIIICIACLTFIFIPLYFQYQRNIFISYERSRMLAFADALIKYMEDPSYSVHNLSDYIEENEGEEYEIHLRDQKTNLLFSSRRKLHGDMETQDSGSSNPGFQPEKYSGDAEPKEDKVKKNITLWKKYNFKGGSYYLFCREKLESMDADKGKGFGLGLFIVKEIAHQGHSKCGYVNHEQGVEFWFDFINQ